MMGVSVFSRESRFMIVSFTKVNKLYDEIIYRA